MGELQELLAAQFLGSRAACALMDATCITRREKLFSTSSDIIGLDYLSCAKNSECMFYAKVKCWA